MFANKIVKYDFEKNTLAGKELLPGSDNTIQICFLMDLGLTPESHMLNSSFVTPEIDSIQITETHPEPGVLTLVVQWGHSCVYPHTATPDAVNVFFFLETGRCFALQRSSRGVPCESV